jgi:hypothetical protein
MDTKLSELEDRMSERMRDMQMEILKAFLPWQESVHRMGILERRLWEIEKRLLMNPPAA